MFDKLTTLVEAINRSDKETILSCLTRSIFSPDIDFETARDEYGTPILILAIQKIKDQNNLRKVIHALLKAGAKLDHVDTNGTTVFMAAADTTDVDFLLLEVLYDPRRGNAEEILNLKNANNETLFIQAAQRGQKNVLLWLVEKFKNIAVVDNQGNTVLHYGVQHKPQDPELLQAIAAICSFIDDQTLSKFYHAKNKENKSASMIAIEQGSDDFAVAFLEQFSPASFPKLNTGNSELTTTKQDLALAIEYKRYAVIKCFINRVTQLENLITDLKPKSTNKINKEDQLKSLILRQYQLNIINSLRHIIYSRDTWKDYATIESLKEAIFNPAINDNSTLTITLALEHGCGDGFLHEWFSKINSQQLDHILQAISKKEITPKATDDFAPQCVLLYYKLKHLAPMTDAALLQIIHVFSSDEMELPNPKEMQRYVQKLACSTYLLNASTFLEESMDKTENNEYSNALSQYIHQDEKLLKQELATLRAQKKKEELLTRNTTQQSLVISSYPIPGVSTKQQTSGITIKMDTKFFQNSYH